MTEDRLEAVYNGMSAEQQEAVHQLVGLALVYEQEKVREALRKVIARTVN